jgi:hypothetical protein
VVVVFALVSVVAARPSRRRQFGQGVQTFLTGLAELDADVDLVRPDLIGRLDPKRARRERGFGEEPTKQCKYRC